MWNNGFKFMLGFLALFSCKAGGGFLQRPFLSFRESFTGVRDTVFSEQKRARAIGPAFLGLLGTTPLGNPRDLLKSPLIISREESKRPLPLAEGTKTLLSGETYKTYTVTRPYSPLYNLPGWELKRGILAMDSGTWLLTEELAREISRSRRRAGTSMPLSFPEALFMSLSFR